MTQMKPIKDNISKKMNIRLFLKGKLQIVAFATLVCVVATSCVDDSATTNANEELSKTEFAGLVKTTLQVSLGGGVTLDPATRSLDSDGAETRSVLIKHSGTRYTPIAEGDTMMARFFIVKETKQKPINGTNAIDPEGMIMGTADIKFKAKTSPNGTIHLYYDESTLPFVWLNNSGVPRKEENWYMCGIIGGEYSKQIAKAAKETTNLATKKLYTQMYNFYVDFDPNLSPKHNQRDTNGNIQVAAPYTTGWFKMTTKKDGVIDEHRLRFKPIGTLLHFRVKREPNLVPAEACRYTFASSQLSANGAFLMMPQSMLRSANDLNQDYKMGVDCEVRPWTNSIEKNFYWSYLGDRQLHMNNTSSDIKTEDNANWGDRIYEYRYTFDAQAMRGNKPKDDYDDFYVWGMPVRYNDSNGRPVIGQTMLTAERGGYMLGRKQPTGSKYPYADEWLYAAGTPALASGEFKVLDFGATDKKNKAYSVEVGVCRPCYSEMENKQLKYPWANPLERVAVTNSIADEKKGFHSDNSIHATGNGWGWIKYYSLKQLDFKQRFVYGSKSLLPEGYHVPSNEEFGLLFPNNITGYSDKGLPVNFEAYSSIRKGSTPYYDLYDPGNDDMRERIVAGEYEKSYLSSMWDNLYWSSKPLFYAYYMANPNNNQEFYAIRFMGNNPEAVSANGHHIYGNRYRCVYRWRFLNLGSGQSGADDKEGPRIVIQSRWIGNANVSIRDITNDKWWGKCASDNPLYQVDCYRVLPSTGYIYKTGWDYWISYWTRTYWGYDNKATDEVYSNNTFCYRSYQKNGFTRGHNDLGRAHYGIRLICNRNQNEFGSNAPRQNQTDNLQAAKINRPADAEISDWKYVPRK